MKFKVVSAFLLFITLHVSSMEIEQKLNSQNDVSLWEKVKKFAINNKSDVMSLGIKAIAAGVGAGAAIQVKNRAEETVNAVGITLESPEYVPAKAMLMRFGPMGIEEGIKTMVENPHIFTHLFNNPYATIFSVLNNYNQIGLAFALYWHAPIEYLVYRAMVIWRETYPESRIE